MKSVRCLTIGDPHFKSSNVPESKEMIQKICNKIKELDPDFVVCLGDILHTHEKIHIEPLCLATSFLLKMAELKPTYLIIGNHDRPNNSDFLTDKHAFNGLKGHNNLYIVDTTEEHVIQNHRFIFVPYVYPGRFMEALNKLENPLTNVTSIFAHQEFLNAKMGAICSKSGDPWSLSNPLVISGHVHEYDHLQKNIIYTGTPMQHSFGEREDKTISYFTFNEDSSWKEERIDLGLIKRKIIRIKVSDFKDNWQPPTNYLLKLIFYGNTAELKAIMKHPRISELQKQKILIAYKEHGKSLTSPLKKPKPREKYLTALQNKIRHNQKLLKTFSNIFN